MTASLNSILSRRAGLYHTNALRISWSECDNLASLAAKRILFPQTESLWEYLFSEDINFDF
jgi:hypothetical protein